ncbi:MAG: M23 family metallopeptidase [Treponema sp.]|nr:M23 family metallopeptidase [Treponema sp.]
MRKPCKDLACFAAQSRRPRNLHGAVCALRLFFIATAAFGDYPLIERLDPRNDTTFDQYVKNVEIGRQLVYNKERVVEPDVAARILTIYAYKPFGVDDFYSVQARCPVGAQSIATLNHMAHPDVFTGGAFTGGIILLPSIPGLFVPLDITGKNANDLEKLMAASRLTEAQREMGVVITINGNGKKERFLFIPGANFSVTEAAFFLTFGKSGKSFQYPLRYFTLTSSFGRRRNPVTGNIKNHDGLDLAAPLGAEVYAAQSGVVTDIGSDSVYGNYIVIKHEGAWASLYGHLSKIEVRLQASVQTGDFIGRVGSTGQSTGPHLHFEIRQNGKAQDPGKYLFKGN